MRKREIWEAIHFNGLTSLLSVTEVNDSVILNPACASLHTCLVMLLYVTYSQLDMIVSLLVWLLNIHKQQVWIAPLNSFSD